MKLNYSPDLIHKFSYKYVALDTNVLILAVSDDDFLKLLHDLKLNNCSFHTVASVYYEFTGTSDNPDNYNKRVKLFEDLEIVIQPIERKMDDLKN